MYGSTLEYPYDPLGLQGIRDKLDTLKNEGSSDVRHYYQKLNETLDRFSDIDVILAHHGPFDTNSLSTDEAKEDSPLNLIRNQRKTSAHLVRLAINVSFFFNLILFAAKVYTAIASGSLVVIASTVDSFMDLLSGAIIFYTATVIRRVNYYHYPIGKSRMEPLGIIVFSAVMITCFFQIMVSSFEKLLNLEAPESLNLSLFTIMLLVGNVIIKFFLWLWCRTMTSSSVQALAQDHMNDVVFNIFSTVFPILATSSKRYWIDPLGAILISMYIIIDWIRTCTENIRRMTGASASAEDIQQLTYLAFRFSNKFFHPIAHYLRHMILAKDFKTH
ncbi:hypothetical protein K7432_010627 [Basidiobolus ranarum]|uniref:Cation efflux protein transmembrane domain-containing protein n=1 Tax=Basidiobolus ranarum TaxID=34480 RepID=A0ABR2VV47_9FUNG